MYGVVVTCKKHTSESSFYVYTRACWFMFWLVSLFLHVFLKASILTVICCCVMLQRAGSDDVYADVGRLSFVQVCCCRTAHLDTPVCLLVS